MEFSEWPCNQRHSQVDCRNDSAVCIVYAKSVLLALLDVTPLTVQASEIFQVLFEECADQAATDIRFAEEVYTRKRWLKCRAEVDR